MSADLFADLVEPEPAPDPLTAVFGEPIHIYTVADGVADGTLVQAPTADSQEAGYSMPVTFTRAAWTDLVAWDSDPGQDESGRLWDVLNTMRGAAKAAMADPGARFRFRLLRVPYLTPSGKRSRAETPRLVTRELVAQGYDRDGRPCITVLMPGED